MHELGKYLARVGQAGQMETYWAPLRPQMERSFAKQWLKLESAGVKLATCLQTHVGVARMFCPSDDLDAVMQEGANLASRGPQINRLMSAGPYGAALFKGLGTKYPILLGITIIVFFIISLIPGDPATAILGSYATPENVKLLNEQLGLDKGLVQRYFIWLGNLVQGDLGRSFALNRPVLDEILERFNATLILSGTAFILCSVVGVLIGTISAFKQYTITDKIITFTVLTGISLPSFFLGMMMILLFAVNLQWLPVSGMYAIYGGGDFLDLIHHLIMPAIALALVATGVVARITRNSVLEILRQDYIRTARAKGVREGNVLFKHVLRIAIVTILPILGLQAGFVLSGSVFIEIVFQWPGVGRMLVDAILKRDILLVQGGVMFVAACYVLFNIAVDLLQRYLDPRIK